MQLFDTESVRPLMCLYNPLTSFISKGGKIAHEILDEQLNIANAFQTTKIVRETSIATDWSKLCHTYCVYSLSLYVG